VTRRADRTLAARPKLACGLVVAAVWIVMFAVWNPVAAAQTYEVPLPIPAGATSQVALSQSNALVTCTPPAYFQPNPTVWTVSTSEVQLGGRPDVNVVPAAGHLLSVTVSSSLQPGQGFFISWTGNTDCASFNGIMYFTVSAPTPPPPPPGGGTAPVVAPRNACPAAFARSALPLARSFVPLTAKIRQQSRKPERLKPLLLRARRLADGAAKRFDLARLAKPRAWRRARSSSSLDRRPPSTHREADAPCSRLGTSLRKGQLKALPEFASRLNKISEYEKVMLELTDEKYAADAEFRRHLDALKTTYIPEFEGRTYAQLNPDERVRVASLAQRETGALQVLLRMARNAGKSALGVVFGR
jgi:hypothetical protein